MILASAGSATALARSRDRVPLASVVAVSLEDDQGTGAENIAEYVKALVAQYAVGGLAPDCQFPLMNVSTDSVRALEGFRSNVVISWLDPLTWDTSVQGPRFGANADFIAYFGDGWEESGGLASVFKGNDDSGWVWVNHEYISNSLPTLNSAPDGQHLTLARYLHESGVLDNDVTSDTWTQEAINIYVMHHKRQLGGSWVHIIQDPASGTWQVDLSAKNQRYDGTSSTLTSVEGFNLSALDQSDLTGEFLPESVISGILGNCSGGQTPWGTVITAEEDVQYYYGDVESAWTILNQFVTGTGFDAGEPIAPVLRTSRLSEFGQSSDSNHHHRRDAYGFLTEIDPGTQPNDFYESVSSGGNGVGHRKIGAMGRARWENASFHVGPDWELMDGQPLVLYAANDRYSGRIYKFVTDGTFKVGMDKGEVRALLDTGTLYVSHLEDLEFHTGNTVEGQIPTESSPGHGRWIELSLDSLDIAPNAETLGSGTTVGAALQDSMWNGIGAFTSNNDVLLALFTAANKIGVSELNRPEDVEWNPRDLSGTPRLYVAFTNHTINVALDEHGVLFNPAMHANLSPLREDQTGSIFVIEEGHAASPAVSSTFSYFAVWVGSKGIGPFDAANPDNLLLDADGGLWFSTDGNFSLNNTADGLYYLDLDPAHKADAEGVVSPTYGKAFRVVAGPSDSETTGPAFSSQMGTIFFSVQHPGQDQYSSWPN